MEFARVLGEGWGIAQAAIAWSEDLWFTGKRIAQVRTPEGVRRLAAHPAADSGRVRTALAYQAGLVDGGCSFLPAVHATPSGNLTYDADGSVWSLTDWAVGDAVFEPEAWSPSMLESVGRRIGELHAAGERVVEDAVPGRPPSRYWCGDWAGFDDWARSAWSELVADEEIRGSPELENLRSAVDSGLSSLGRLSARTERRVTITHDDLWTAHVLLVGNEISAIIDLDGLDIGDPLGDVAALVSDFAELDPQRSAAAIRGYRSVATIDTAEIARLIDVVAGHHALVLIERARLWKHDRERRAELIRPLGFWLRSLAEALSLDPIGWAQEVESLQ